MPFENINIRNILQTALAKDAIIIDVRSHERFLSGHIPMSVNIPLDRIQSGDVKLPRSKTLIVYCDTGGASMQAARNLADMGYNVINCIGGIRNYNGAVTS